MVVRFHPPEPGVEFVIRGSSSGRTRDSGSRYGGSIPSPRADGVNRSVARPRGLKTRILTRLRDGQSYTQIVSELGCSRGTIAFHGKAIGHSKRGRKPTYDWVEIRCYYDTGHSVAECASKFGFAKNTWSDAVKRGLVQTRPAAKPLGEILCRGAVKRRVLREGILKNVCAECGLAPVWRGKPLVLVLDHINGVKGDHRVENLRLLCPNCNSQTPTFSGRNLKFVRG
jgi:hypothetical protein